MPLSPERLLLMDWGSGKHVPSETRILRWIPCRQVSRYNRLMVGGAYRELYCREPYGWGEGGCARCRARWPPAPGSRVFCSCSPGWRDTGGVCRVRVTRAQLRLLVGGPLRFSRFARDPATVGPQSYRRSKLRVQCRSRPPRGYAWPAARRPRQSDTAKNPNAPSRSASLIRPSPPGSAAGKTARPPVTSQGGPAPTPRAPGVCQTRALLQKATATTQQPLDSGDRSDSTPGKTPNPLHNDAARTGFGNITEPP